MLLNVHIKNIALIEDANINFTDGLNILTGETGAGKSIIMGALKGRQASKRYAERSGKRRFLSVIIFY